MQNRRGTQVRFHPDPQIFGDARPVSTRRALFRMTRSKAYLFGGVEIRWSCDPSLLQEGSRDAGEGGLPLPRRPQGLSAGRRSARSITVTREIFAGKTEKSGGHGAVEWAVTWYGGDRSSLLLQHHPDTREAARTRPGLRIALTKGLKNYAELTQNKRAAIITTDDVMISAVGMLSVFIREPEFVGQTKDKLATVEAQRIVENALRDPFDH